ncbi:MAG TPA: nucleotide exchange factor GrpE [Terracidiphilus sp.]|nr:nucleotide exchange factor GrpE [Terracidiphilus sp.]
MHKHETEFADLETPEITAGTETGPQPEQEFAAGPQSAAGPQPVADAAELVSRTELDQVKAERDHLLDRMARLQAEFDNARKRAEREKVEFRDIATGNVVENFLPVIDNFQLALNAPGNADQLRSGVALIVKQMEETLQKMQVSAIPAVGEPFDPRLHEALGSVEREDVPDQHVAEEIRRGYRLRDRLLRPALVRVAHNSKQTSE